VLLEVEYCGTAAATFTNDRQLAAKAAVLHPPEGVQGHEIVARVIATVPDVTP
jgi:hypothetical protein